MKDSAKVFIDTNILVYGFYGLPTPKETVVALFKSQTEPAIISIQVLKEFTNASIRKKLYKSREELNSYLINIRSSFFVSEITLETILDALDLGEEYRYSFYDSLIIATALQSGCTILYSEDMQHEQIIRKKLKIINPFK
jgi:predicted nucleic acid-binding protein